jgi:hypothetical protein
LGICNVTKKVDGAETTRREKVEKEISNNSIITSRGKNWHASTVKYILENPIYKGKLQYKGIKFISKDLAII